ncbi:hypothetical protein [Naasia aerilata]|uniref:Uncharacterized protein n=1 Tax=Naasia aerilata TaxID=1162966 RepID=A0ABN6XL53_9MICO|nr:hypothetical protein [Naasia aerilata]BDZ45596.1 hypothetical protein GCM10025866_15050 [Naasia aerilata]
MTLTLGSRTPTWTKVSDDLISGETDGNYAGMIERSGTRWVARDAFGALVGRFAAEQDARAAFEPAALTAAWNRREHRERVIAAATAIGAAGSSVLMAFGLLSLLPL